VVVESFQDLLNNRLALGFALKAQQRVFATPQAGVDRLEYRVAHPDVLFINPDGNSKLHQVLGKTSNKRLVRAGVT
jgi:hypothetical protein